MPRRSRWMQLLAGLAAGVTLGIFLKLCVSSPAKTTNQTCSEPLILGPDPYAILKLSDNETISNSKKTLLFVGVMTAAQYLETRARAVADTWAKDLPGRLAFFSSETSRARHLPLVPLRGVDDTYPPQKKSFLMLLYMFENFGDRFEWYMRADDDVYVRGDKLETFLRSVDSRKPQFIGQAGRGTAEERDALKLEDNENFCMGGPGVLMSRETLRRVAPHVQYCLENLYTTHEDVELGRCVAKFAGVSCTWSYDMQTILHHNSSGAAAYTGNLKKREVHRAITLHPVKDHRIMYKIHAYFKNYKIQELRERELDLHRGIANSMKALGVKEEEVSSYVLPNGSPLFPAKIGEPGFLGDNNILGAPVDFDRHHPADPADIIPFDYVSKSIYSAFHTNPKRRVEMLLKEAFDDVIRDVMEIINAPSRQRGRVIDFNELLYGYVRLDPEHGVDYVLDLLLKYRRYRGRKMTAAVRRHAYLQQTFSALEIEELPLGEPPSDESTDYEDFDEADQKDGGFLDFGRIHKPLKEVWENGILKIQNNLPNVWTWTDDGNKKYSLNDRKIHFILPLSGRHEVFERFMKNYEDIVLVHNEAVRLIVVLYIDGKNPQDYERSESLLHRYKESYSDIVIVKMGSTRFSRGTALTEGMKSCLSEDLVLFIDVDMMFNFITLRRIRVNTVKYNQVYFPIVFSEYNPDVVNGDDYNKLIGDPKDIKTNLGRYDVTKLVGKSDREIANLKYTKIIEEDFGYFRQFGYGILSIYKCDFERVGGFNLTIKGWGKEDVDLFETLIKTNMTVFRISDDSLVHIYHNVECDKSLDKDQYTMCLGSKASTQGNEKQMRFYALNHPNALKHDKEGS